MQTLLRAACCILLLEAAGFPVQSAVPAGQDRQLEPAPQGPTLEDGTSVRLRISQTISSANAHVNDRVQFEVLEGVRVADTLIIPRGSMAWGTVSEAQPKRTMGRGGKLEIVMESVRLLDGERAPLRATKEAKGGDQFGTMAVGIVGAGSLFWPVAPFFLLMHGKDINIPVGTEVLAFVNGNFKLDFEKFQHPDFGTLEELDSDDAEEIQSYIQKRQAPPEGMTEPEVEIMSTPDGADIEVDGLFVGTTPSTFGLPSGQHTIIIEKRGWKRWERKLKVTKGLVTVAADLEPEPTPTQTSQ